MKKRYLWTILAVGVLSLLFAIGLFVAEYRKETPDFPSLWQNMLLSIFCSIVASVLFCMLQIFDDKDNDTKDDEFRKTVSRNLRNINTKLKIQNQLYDSGIVSIRKKSFYDKDGKFWKDIIGSASNKLDLIGHSISKWFDEEYKGVFVEKIHSMLKEGKEVRIILSGDKPDMKKIQAAEKSENERYLLNKIENTCYELRQIARKHPKNKKRLLVFITDIHKVTYMYIRTDTRCFISPYIYSATNSAGSFLLELETRVDYSKCFEQDFNEMLRSTPLHLDLGDKDEA